MNRQELLQLIQRNQRQIELLYANNIQLVEALLETEAQAAAISVAAYRDPATAAEDRAFSWSPEQRAKFESSLRGRTVIAPTVADARRIGRPPGSKTKPKEKLEPVRYDTLGRRIPEQKVRVAPNRGKTWSPQHRAKMKAIREAKKKAGLSWTGAKLPKRSGKFKDPKVEAEWKRKLSLANRAARARKAAAGLDYTSGKPIAKASTA